MTMQSEKLVLRERQGRKVVYREIRVPTEDEMRRLATEMHAVRSPAMRDVMGWRVVYMPSFPIRYASQEVDPFSGQSVGQVEESESRSVSWCTFGHEQAWGLTLSWANGDDQPPVVCNQRGDIVEGSPVLVQESLFTATHERSDDSILEGTRSRTEANDYERNPEARRRCLEHYGFQCVVCHFDFEATFGDFARGFIHVHHVRPLASIGHEYRVDPIKDLRPVCPNCHSALHLQEPAMTPDELRAILERRRNA